MPWNVTKIIKKRHQGLEIGHGILLTYLWRDTKVLEIGHRI